VGVPFYGHLQETGAAPFGPRPRLGEKAQVETGEMIYISGRRDTATCPHKCENCGHACQTEVARYHIQGVFATAEECEAVALDETYFVGPLPFNVGLPHSLIEWRGLYWPLKGKPDDTVVAADPPPSVANPEPSE
jgi:hypothetical protein